MTFVDALILVAGFFVFLAVLSLIERLTFKPIFPQKEYSPEEEGPHEGPNIDDPGGLIDVRSPGSLPQGVRDVRAEFALRYINKNEG